MIRHIVLKKPFFDFAINFLVIVVVIVFNGVRDKNSLHSIKCFE